MKKLAILGDAQMSQQIISTLIELGGGNNQWGYKGSCPEWCYCIGEKDRNIRALPKREVVMNSNYLVLTFQEFEQMYYLKPGDSARIIGEYRETKVLKRTWSSQVGDMIYQIEVKGDSAPKGAIGWWYHNALVHDVPVKYSPKIPGNYNETRSFGFAIRALKGGYKVTREGWNGKGMYLWLKPPTKVNAEFCKDPILKEIAQRNGGEIEALGTICMKTADNKVLTGWLANQTDMLAEDWRII